MKVTKALLGQSVRVLWRDPCRVQYELQAGSGEPPRGEKALPLWREEGYVKDITDDVLMIVHSSCTESGEGHDTWPQYHYSLVPADRIETIQILSAEAPKEGT